MVNGWPQSSGANVDLWHRAFICYAEFATMSAQVLNCPAEAEK